MPSSTHVTRDPRGWQGSALLARAVVENHTLRQVASGLPSARSMVHVFLFNSLSIRRVEGFGTRDVWAKD